MKKSPSVIKVLLIIFAVIILGISGICGGAMFLLKLNKNKDNTLSSLNKPVNKGGQLTLSNVSMHISDFKFYDEIKSLNEKNICHTSESDKKFIKVILSTRNTNTYYDSGEEIVGPTRLIVNGKEVSPFELNPDCIVPNDTDSKRFKDLRIEGNKPFEAFRTQAHTFYFEIDKSEEDGFILKTQINGYKGFLEL